MRFHGPSFALGVISGVAVRSAGERVRPVVVELGALAVHLGRIGRALVERQREHVEDLWAEVGERARARARGSARSAPNGRVATPQPEPSAAVTH